MNHDFRKNKRNQGLKLKNLSNFASFNNNKYRYKYLSTLSLEDQQIPIKQRKIRSLKCVKYITNLQHNMMERNKVSNYIVSRTRHFLGRVTIFYPEQKAYFLKKVREIRYLDIKSSYNTIRYCPKTLSSALKKLSHVNVLRFSFEENLPVEASSVEQLIKTYSRRSICSFKMHSLEYSLPTINFDHFSLVRLKSLFVNKINPTILSILLLKAGAFQELETLSLGTMIVDEDYPSYLVQNFSLFPKLKALSLQVRLVHEENSRIWLKKFKLGPSMTTLHLKVNEIYFPDPLNCDETDYIPYETFSKNFSSAHNLEDLKLSFIIFKDFIGLNRMIKHLPHNLSNIKKLLLEFLPDREKNAPVADTRIIMKDIFRWIFSMPLLEKFWLEALSRDYTGLSGIEIPPRLALKEFDILEWPEEAQDTLKHDDFKAFLKLIERSNRMECLNLSIESAHFNLEAFKELGETLKTLTYLQQLNLKLNCRKFSLNDFALIEPCLRNLNRLEILSIMFISNAFSETEVWRYKLCKTFENYRKLSNFNLSLYAPTKPVFVLSYYNDRLDQKKTSHFGAARRT